MIECGFISHYVFMHNGHPTALAAAGDISLWLQGFNYRKFENINVIANSIDQQEHLLYIRAENEDELKPFHKLNLFPLRIKATGVI